MILRFAIHPDALDGASPISAHHRSLLLEALAQFGIVCWSDDMKTETLRRLRKLQPDEQMRWVETLKEVARQRRTGCLMSVGDPADCVASDREELVVFNTSRFETLFGTDKIAHELPDSRTEVARVDTLGSACALTTRRDAATSDLWTGEDRSTVWSTRFAPLVEASRRVVISDPYAFRNRDALIWVLTEMGAGPNAPASITVYSSFEPHVNEPELELDALHDSLPATAASVELRFVVVRPVLMPRISHDRYMRFDDSRLVKIGNGIDVFEQHRLVRPCHFTYVFMKRKAERDRYRETEIRLSKNSLVDLRYADGYKEDAGS